MWFRIPPPPLPSFFPYSQVKSMVQHLHKAGKLGLSRQDRFSAKFMKDVEVLVGMISVEIAEKHIKVCPCLWGFEL